MPQIGSYFGSEITSVDINDDRVTDVLLVGAPMYFSEGRERGKVYVYNLRQVLWPGEARHLCRASESYTDLLNLEGTQVPRRPATDCRSQLGRTGASLSWAPVPGRGPGEWNEEKSLGAGKGSQDPRASASSLNLFPALILQSRFVYNGTLKDSHSYQNARFGSCIASVQDLNQDSYNDVVVGAPLEDSHRGAIYIFHGFQSSILKKPIQVGLWGD